MKTLNLLLGLALAASATTQNQVQKDAATVIEAATKTMGTATLQSIRYAGSGTNNSVG